jgi:sarcosine oxidase
LAQYEEEQCVAMTGEKPSESLLNMTGGLMIGPTDSIVVQGTLNSVRAHSLSHQIFTADELHERYPMLTPSPGTIGIFETEAGYLVPEACITAHCTMAQSHGAVLRYHETFLSWEAIASPSSHVFQFGSQEKEEDLLEISTTLSRYRTKKLILTVGAWAPELYGSSINLTLRTERRVLYWFRPTLQEEHHSFQVVSLSVVAAL